MENSLLVIFGEIPCTKLSTVPKLCRKPVGLYIKINCAISHFFSCVHLHVHLVGFMLTFSEEYLKLTDSISLMCETWWNKDLRMKELLVTNMILFVLAKTHNTTKVQHCIVK